MQKISTLLFLLLFTVFAIAQNATISGKVLDRDGKKPLANATVMLLGTEMGAYADENGAFLIENVTPGTYDLVASFVSYVDDTVKVTAKANETTNIEVVIGINSTQVVQIEAQVAKQSAAAIIVAQKQSTVIMTGISLDEIKKTPDRNTSDVLKRLSGVTVQDNKFVVIRGLSDRYNAVTLNGLPLSSTEPDRRAFSFDLFPATLLDNLTITKTAIPNLTGEFAGGIISLNTKEVPEEAFLSITASSGANSQSTFRPYAFYQGGKLDFLGINDGTRNLPADLPNTDSLKKMLSAPGEARYTASRLLPIDWKYSNRNSMAPQQNYQISGGKEFKIGEQSIGLVGAVNYSNQWRMTRFIRQDFDIDTTRRYNYQDNQYRQVVNTGGILNLAWKMSKGNKIYTNNLISMSGDDKFVERNGVEFTPGERYEKSNLMYYTAYVLRTHQLLGEHTSKKEGLKIKWGTSYNQVNRSTPNVRRMFYTKSLYPQDESDTVFRAFIPYGAAQPNYAGTFFSDQVDKSISGNLDITLDYKFLKQKDNKFKFGGAVLSRNKVFDARVFGYSVANPGSYNTNLEFLPQDSIFLPENIKKEGYRMQEITSKQDSYNAEGTSYAGYAMVEQKFTKSFKGILGVRFESYRQVINAMTFGGDSVQVDTTINNWLPSVNLIYKLNEDMNLRFSGSRTVSRPIFRELSPFQFFDFELNAAIQGNPALVPTNIDNFDLRYEWFPGFNQMLAFTAFYKNFTNPIEQITDKGGTTTLYTFTNTPKAQAYGGELEFRVRATALRYIVDWKQWDNFSAFGNFALIQSRVDQSNIPGMLVKYRQMQGQSPYVINTGISYNNPDKGTTATLSFNRIGRRIWSVGTVGAVGSRYLEIFEGPRSVLDFQISQKVFKNGEIKLNLADVLNQRLNFYQDEDGNKKFSDGDKLIIGTTFGWNSSLGFSYKF